MHKAVYNTKVLLRLYENVYTTLLEMIETLTCCWRNSTVLMMTFTYQKLGLESSSGVERQKRQLNWSKRFNSVEHIVTF